MSKRMKRVFSSHYQVLHLWANQSQSDARCKNVFYEGDTVYSYGTHYVLGKLAQVNGQTVALINSEKYSVTTAKHQRDAWDAVAHLPRIRSSSPDNQNVNQEILLSLTKTQEELIDALMSVFSRRSFWSTRINDVTPWVIQNELSDYNRMCDVLKLKNMRIDIPTEFKKLMQEHAKLSMRRKTDPEYLAKKLRKAEAEITAWRYGGALTTRVRELFPQLIRVRDDQVETSRGALVPLEEAKKLWKKIVFGNVKKGEKIGSFSLDTANNQFIKVGCHTISFKEAQQVLGAITPLKLVK